MHDERGATRLPRRQHGLGMMLVWAAAAGVILAFADVLLEQRKASASES